jgi:hypothetical protein
MLKYSYKSGQGIRKNQMMLNGTHVSTALWRCNETRKGKLRKQAAAEHVAKAAKTLRFL